MRGVHVRQVVEGRVEVEIFAGEAWHSRNADWVGGRQVRVLYFPPGKKRATLNATTARYDIQERQLEAWGAVRVESDGAVLETTHLTYDARRARIESREFVRITRGDNVLTGLGLEADPDLGNLQVAEPHINARNPREIKPLIEGLKTDAPARR
jgi:LPS export ABC transporter protein LptC